MAKQRAKVLVMFAPDLLDIYTLKPMAKPSSEHIIHNFLGGSLEGPLLDESTNSLLGHTIDAALHRNLQELLLRLDLRGNTSSEPPRAKNRVAADEEGRSWRLTAGGQLECENVQFRVFEVSVTNQGGLQLNIAVDGGARLTAESVTQMILTRLKRDPRVPAVLRERPPEAAATSRRAAAGDGGEDPREDRHGDWRERSDA